MSRPVFSIITPVYNAEDKLEKTIKSVLEQNIDECEHVIIDGGSTDRTIDIAYYYSNKYPDKVRYISEPDKGIYDAMNKGISLSKGVYINFQGAGDTLRDNILAEIKQHLSYTLEIVYGQIYLEKSKYVMGEKSDSYTIAQKSMPHPAMFYNYRVFEKLGKYSLEYPIGADHIFNIQCMGDHEIDKKYINLVISNFEETGISSWGKDQNLAEKLFSNIYHYLGEEYAMYCKMSGAEFANFNNYIQDAELMIITHQAINKQLVQELNNNIKVINLHEKKILDMKGIVELMQQRKQCKMLLAVENYRDLMTEYIGQGISVDRIMIYRSYIYSRQIEIFMNQITEMTQVYLFGASRKGEQVKDYFNSHISDNKIKIKGFLDNDPRKWGLFLGEYIILGIQQIIIDNNTKFIITSMFQNEIMQQLLNEGIKAENIILS